MKLLLDTHILLWWLDDSPRLSATARGYVTEPTNRIYLSAASLWEIRIKQRLGKLDLPPHFDQVLDQSEFEWLAITRAHTSALAHIPLHHRDPFDRMLLAQAQYEGLTLLTSDDQLTVYGANVLRIAPA